MKPFLMSILVLTVLGLTGCGKNGAYTNGYGYPLVQAPAYPGQYPYGTGSPYGTPSPYGGYPSAYPSAGYPSSYPYSSPGFTPQMPQGYPAAYTPFLPIDYYMRSNPQTAAYWPQFWNQWTTFCGRQGYSPYNFSYFWYQYVPRYWNNGPYAQLYASFNAQFYSWMTPGVQFASNMNPSTFWQGYSGYGYGPSWTYSY